MGRSLPRAIASAASAGRAPAFENPTSATIVATTALARRDNASTPSNGGKREGLGKAEISSSVEGFEEMLAGNPKRAMAEIDMRSRLEIVKEEVEVALKMHESMAKGERESWLKQIERRNEEDAYQVQYHIRFFLSHMSRTNLRPGGTE